ncbi:Methyl-CpG-binding domain-containing protein 13 [Rhynchospora pubera]|uniref:Methyl-CpG-binding domain-containing protein 13 n=1 Tax=Rhynchospora pubera TaxID=906938 RepID=A0AAV8GRE8_9POAL|nr:Methyl-CpG-binding domain-containing protein 13 [Rhynchospora pubera]
MWNERQKLPEVITICDSMDESSDSDRPGWLPDGWEMVSRCKNNKNISIYYPCPMCEGITLRTQDEVLRHCLFLCEDAPSKSQLLFEATPRHPQPVRHINEPWPLKDGQISGSSKKGERFGSGLFDSIPQDWIIEIRRGPRKYGKIYKFYLDPTKEYRFSSKDEVQFYLEGKPLNPASNTLLSCDTEGDDNILAEMTFSPGCLPYGWIKEMRYRSKCVNGKKSDPYYTDPESGLVFRSLVDVKRYLQTGEVSKNARVPRQTITDLYSFECSAEMVMNSFFALFVLHLLGKF